METKISDKMHFHLIGSEANSVYYPQCPSVCVSVYAIAENPLPGVLETSVEGCMGNIVLPSLNYLFSVLMIFCILQFVWVFGQLTGDR